MPTAMHASAYLHHVIVEHGGELGVRQGRSQVDQQGVTAVGLRQDADGFVHAATVPGHRNDLWPKQHG